MQAAKTFDRNGVRYRPGDPLPEGLDKVTLEHYKRHGMVREVRPAETKPAASRQRKPAEPRQLKPAAPAAVSQGEQIQLEQASPDIGTQADMAADAAGGDAAAAETSEV